MSILSRDSNPYTIWSVRVMPLLAKFPASSVTATESVPDSESEVPLSTTEPLNVTSVLSLSAAVLSSVHVAASVPPIESFPTSRVTALPPKTLNSLTVIVMVGALVSLSSGLGVGSSGLGSGLTGVTGVGVGSSGPHETTVPHAASRTLRARRVEINFKAEA